jgi:DNA-binding IclR family transcriptional regulator
MAIERVEAEEKPVAAVERALSVLDAFRPGDSALSLAELAKRTGLYHSTILRLAQTLERSNYLIRTLDGRYRIGSKPFYLGSIFQHDAQPADLILPVLNALSASTGESAAFHIRDGDQRICLYRVDSPQVIRDHTRPGAIMPLERGAAGRTIVAFQKPWDAAFAAQRQEFLTFTVEEITPGVASLAVPIFDADQGVLGALALSGPKHRFAGDALDDMRTALLESGHRLTKDLGGDTTPWQRFR